MKLKSKFVVNALLVFTLLVAVAWKMQDRYKIALNYTGSLNDYFFVIDNDKNISNIKKGDVISFLFDKKDDKYYAKPTMFGKKIFCAENDILEVNKLLYSCNGRVVGVARTQDSKGVEIPNFVFSGVIPKDKYFVMGTASNSYDSRYWGFVDKKEILGVALW